MKKRVLLSSILTIALCLCLIAGSTFALFTDTTDFDISVTSGNVEILATAKVNSVYSAEPTTDSTLSDEFLIDEYRWYYKHVKQDDGVTFLNDGTAKVVDGTVVIERITPGDRVDVDIIVDNTSDVAISYRYKIVASHTNLAKGMVVTTFNMDGTSTATEGLAIWTSDWYTAAAPDGTAEPIPTRTISIELPVYAGNEYQSEKTNQEDGRVAGKQSVEYTIIVEAVQDNASTRNEEKFLVYETEVLSNLDTVVDDVHFNNPTNCVYINELYLQGDANIKVDQGAPFVIENVTSDVNGSVIIIDGAQPAIQISNCDFLLDAGEYIIDASAAVGGYPQYQVFLENVTVNGELLPIGICDPAIEEYFNNVAWYQVVDPTLVY